MFELQKWLFSLATADLKDFASGASAFSASAALAIATLFGSVHALMPGHGKLALVSIFIFVGCTMLLRERALRKHGPWAQSIRVMDTTTTITARTIAVTTTNVPITPMGMAMTTNTVTATGTASSTRRSGPGHRCCGLRQRRI